MATRDELIKKASQLAFEYERDFGGCAQCVLAAIKDSVGVVSDDVFQAATGLAGGVGLQGRACGALTGGVMALSSFFGRDYAHFNDLAGQRFITLRMCGQLAEKFKAEFGSPDCFDIQTKIMGQWYNLADPTAKAAFLDAGGHDDKCTMVCAKAAQWVLEILDDEGLLDKDASGGPRGTNPKGLCP